MKKLVVLLVLVVMVMVMAMTMVSCDNAKSPDYIDVSRETVIIDDYRVGYVDSYGEYYCFESDCKSGYLSFLDHMDEKIEIISIDVTYAKQTRERYFVTYKLLDEN